MGHQKGLPKDMRVDPAAPPPRYKAAMWRWFLAQRATGIAGSYGSVCHLYMNPAHRDPDWDEHLTSIYREEGRQVRHLRACGVNVGASSEVEAKSWSKWVGTFADDECVTGLEGTATCNCGEVTAELTMEGAPSLSRMLREILEGDEA